MRVETVTIANPLTRTGGYLRGVTSHSLQPYRGCSFGQALCGAGCYVQHQPWVLRGRVWGTFLEARANAAEGYRANVARERAWARRQRGDFSIFLSSSTEPFVPQEARLGITASLLDAMRDEPPDRLIVQTHSHTVADHSARLAGIAERSDLRVHISVETDRESIPGLPPHASSIEQRLAAALSLKRAGLAVVICVAPLLPIAAPERFFARIAEAATAVVIDHYIGGDGSADGSRTLRTALPEAIAALDPEALGLDYRERIAGIAERFLPGRVGIGAEGFRGRYRP